MTADSFFSSVLVVFMGGRFADVALLFWKRIVDSSSIHSLTHIVIDKWLFFHSLNIYCIHLVSKIIK